MKLVRYRNNNPWSALDNLHDEMDKLFNFSWGDFPLRAVKESFAPAVDMWEDGNNVYLEADLPGFEQKDVSVKVKDQALVISAKKEEEKQENLPAGSPHGEAVGKAGKKNYHYYERFSGNFYRAVGLPADVNTNKVTANYKNGVLNVTLPKKEEKKEKDIDIAIE